MTRIDRKLTEQISLKNLHAYVVSRHWDLEKQFEFVTIYSKQDADGHKAFARIPRYDETEDRFERVVDALTLFASVEDRDVRDVVTAVRLVDRDHIRVRAVDETSIIDGTIPAVAGRTLFETAISAAIAAAGSAEKPRAVIRGRQSAHVQEYIKELRMGQTEEGSFIVHLFAPLSLPSSVAWGPRVAHSVPLAFSAPPGDHFPRRSTQVLHDALTAAKNAVESDRAVSSEEALELVSKGVSTNLLTSLHKIAAEKMKSFEFAFGWSPMLEHENTSPVDFVESRIERFDELNRALQKHAEPVEEWIVGSVITAHRSLNDIIGDVVVAATVGTRPIRICIELPEEPFSIVLEALDKRRFVSMYGILARKGNRWRLSSVRDVGFFEPTEPDGDPEDEATKQLDLPIWRTQ